jgi:hypothetical protein
MGHRAGLDIMEKNLLPLSGIEPGLLGHQAHILVAIPTELSRLRKCFLAKEKDQYTL